MRRRRGVRTIVAAVGVAVGVADGAAVSVGLGAWPVAASASTGLSAAGLSVVQAQAGGLVWVTDRVGRVRLVRVVRATDGVLTVTDGGVPSDIGVAEILQVAVDGDSPRSGAFIGVAAGVPAGLLSCQGASHSRCDGVTRAVAGAAIYGAVGALIDWWHHGRTVVYRAPRSSP